MIRAIIHDVANAIAVFAIVAWIATLAVAFAPAL